MNSLILTLALCSTPSELTQTSRPAMVTGIALLGSGVALSVGTSVSFWVNPHPELVGAWPLSFFSALPLLGPLLGMVAEASLRTPNPELQFLRGGLNLAALALQVGGVVLIAKAPSMGAPGPRLSSVSVTSTSSGGSLSIQGSF